MNTSNTSGPEPKVRPLIQAYCYHDPDFYPPVINAIRLLCRAGFDVELYTRETGKAHQVSYPLEAKVIRLDNRGKGSFSQFFAFLRATTGRARRDAAIFWGHDMHGFAAARLAAWRRHRPLIYHCHDYAEAGWMSAGAHVVHAFERCFARTADAVVIPDAGRAEVIARDLGLHQPPLVAANAPLLTPLVRRHALRHALHARGYRFDKVVFRQGKIGQGHGIEATIRSMPAWQRRDWGFVVIGLSDAGYVSSLEQLALDMGVSNQFVALPPVSYDEILHYTPDADVGHALYEQIHNSNIYIGTASNKAMEYLAAGVPLLVSPNAKLKQIVADGNCGVWADERDPASIAQGINTLLANSETRERMGIAARKAFEEIYCYDRQYLPVLARMRELAHSPRLVSS
jgi:glycosyltransferase involved in cell wall biosynthesis